MVLAWLDASAVVCRIRMSPVQVGIQSDIRDEGYRTEHDIGNFQYRTEEGQSYIMWDQGLNFSKIFLD